MMPSIKDEKKYEVTVEVHNTNPDHIGAECYLTGNFNGWAMPGYKLGNIPNVGENLHAVIADVAAGTLEVKLNRGDWKSCLAYGDGRIAEAVSIEVPEKKHLRIRANHWRDEFPKSTASPQVHLLDQAFYLPNLAVHRRLWIYIPEGYENTDKMYPVIYMHDGQQLFDEAFSIGRAGPVEWKVDETIDAAEVKAIVVGIDHADSYNERLDEYLVKPFDTVEAPRGLLYLRDIIEVIKPYIDREYRTLTAAKYTAVAGSSAGGLITLYAGLCYPEIFGTVAAFSPSLWMGNDLIERYEAMPTDMKVHVAQQAYYFYAGRREIRQDKYLGKVDLAADMEKFVAFFAKQGTALLKTDIDPHGKHGALYWQRAFVRFYDWWTKTYIVI
ncbi:MAG: alpha/beta hydrolase [Sphingobacterium sp.]|jgi:metallo-beta-lactamase class B|uniref:alpha/beta hydrolase n=1 Tax=Sphingobacterium sp. TaxID=341027 RepID=UPI00284B7CEB|nr:alpha/beta hydrolase-fold protein [Sphingobacterium sp.]MDR3008208.1 alpha/beta hydrolase [Sphingobacterium sp.]